MAVSDYSVINQRTQAWAMVDMLKHAEPILVLQKHGLTKPVPKNKADNVKFRRPVPFAISTVPVVEGVTPAAQSMAYVDVSVTLDQYAGLVTITDKVADLAEDPVLSDATMQSGEQASETLEMVLYGKLKAGTNVAYTNGASRAEVNTKVSLGSVRAAVKSLKAQRAKPHTKMLSGSVNYNTTPIEGAYIAFGHTDLDPDIRDLPGFIPVAEYGSRQPLCSEELGTVENIRYITSPLLVPFLGAGSGTLNGMMSNGGTNVDVYPLLVCGKEAYGSLALKGSSAVQLNVMNPDTPSKSDPHGQRGHVAWKTWYAGAVLNEAWMIRIECGASDL